MITLKALIKAKFAATSDNVEYTCPAATQARIEAFTACNTDTSDQTLWVNIIPSGSAVGNSNLFLKNFTITAGEAIRLDVLFNHVLEAGDKISAYASAGSVSIMASGREVA